MSHFSNSCTMYPPGVSEESGLPSSELTQIPVRRGIRERGAFLGPRTSTKKNGLGAEWWGSLAGRGGWGGRCWVGFGRGW